MPALDGLRAVAIALVVVYHATHWPAGGWLGVDVFFVLSGFLITTLLVERHGRESIATFYRRRAARLLPALLVLLLVALAVDRSLFAALAGLGYFSNLVLATGNLSLIPESQHHLWSLAMEEQFYVVWPVVLYLALRRGVGAALAVSCGLVAAALVESSWLALHGGASGRLVMFSPDTRGASLLVGCALALGLAIRPLVLSRFEIPAIAVLLGSVAVVGPGMYGAPLLLFAIACAVLTVRALDGRSLLSRALSVAPIVFLGRISYSLFLWHLPVLMWIGAGYGLTYRDAIGIPLAVVVACASYFLVEQPFLRMARRRMTTPRASTPDGTASGQLVGPRPITA